MLLALLRWLLQWWLARHPVLVLGPPPSLPYETVLIAAAVSPFVTAFATKLGERLGTEVMIKRLSWRERRRRRGELVVESPYTPSITLEVGTGLTDEARLALIELDVGRPELWGHRLRWDEGVKAWLPVPDRPGNGAIGLRRDL